MNPSDPQADALARWLEAHPGDDPPDDLDPDVIEAVYMLRPDLAPAPRVSADDILASMGAFPIGGDAPEDAATAGPAPVVELPRSVVEAPETPRPANRRAVWAALGSVAAMAAAVLVVAQVALNGGSSPMHAAEPTAAPAVVARSQTGGAELENAPVRREEMAAPDLAAAPDQSGGSAARGVQRPGPPPPVADPEPLAAPALDAVADVGEESVEELDLNQEGGEDIDYRSVAGNAQTGADQPVTISDSDSLVTTGLIGGDSFNGIQGDTGVVVDGLGDLSADFAFDAVADVDAPNEPEGQAEPLQQAAALDDVFDPSPADIPPSVPEEEEQPARSFDEYDVSVAALDDVEVVRGEPAAEDVAVVLTETASRGGRRRNDRRPRREPQSAAEAPAPAVAVPEPAPPIDPVQQARGRAAQLAAVQQFSGAFDVLAPYVSPSAPVTLIVEAAEYAFAAGRWNDVVAVTTPRLNAPRGTDSAQQRARLFDLQARAQAMQVPVGRPAMRMEDASSTDE